MAFKKETPGIDWSDEDLLYTSRKGDLEAFRLLHDRYRGPVAHYLQIGCGSASDVEDLCQEIFLRLYRFAHHFRQGLAFRPWLFTIAGNELRRFLRQRRNGVGLDGVAEPADPSRPQDQLTAEEAVRIALDKLPVEQKEVVMMKQYGGLTFSDIALVMNCSENTVKSRMYYALTKLKEYLQEFAPDA